MDKKSLEKLEPLVAKCGYLRFKEYGIDQELATKYTLQELSDSISKNDLVLGAKEQDEFIGAVSLENLNWDSKHFGIECKKINQLIARGDYFESLRIKQKLITNLLANYHKKSAIHISARVYKEDLSSIHALESKSFRLMDFLVTYIFNLRKQKIPDIETQIQIAELRQDEIPQLAELAQECFDKHPVSTDRFHADPNLPKEKSGELYVKWAISSYKNKSNKVLLARLNGQPVGFTIGNLDSSFAERFGTRLGTIVLTGVKASERGKHISNSLWNALLKWFISKADLIETGAQISNYPVQVALSQTGFRIVRAQCTFHWSKSPSTNEQ